MKLVKLGGSVITYKGRTPRYRRVVTESLAAQLAPFKDELCIVHGGGSFGHPLAHRYRLHRGGAERRELMGFAEVRSSMKVLNGRLLEALHSVGIPAVSIPPFPLLKMRDGRITSFHGQPLLDHLEAGLVPVTYGDVVLDDDRGSAIVSGDDLMYQLARLLKPGLAIFVADVEGIRGEDESLVPVVSAPLTGLEAAEEGLDVTGGLGGKVRAMLQIARLGTRVLLLSGLVPGRLQAAMEGQSVPCTEVVESQRPD